MKRDLGILLMKRIVFLFSIVLMLCSCKSFEDHSNEKAVGTYKNGYILNLTHIAAAFGEKLKDS